jgi:hypothetical protein
LEQEWSDKTKLAERKRSGRWCHHEMEATDLEAKLLIEQKKSSADVRSKLANQKQKQ